jgi:hypothetical protein
MKKKVGRKTLLNAKLQKQICDLLAEGVPIGATCDAVGIGQKTYFEWCNRNPQFSQVTTRARGQARVSLLKKIKLSDDWRAHAWILSHCWPEEFSERRILQPEPSKPLLQINYSQPDAKTLEFNETVAESVRKMPKAPAHLVSLLRRFDDGDLYAFSSIPGDYNLKAKAPAPENTPANENEVEHRYNPYTKKIEPIEPLPEIES